MTQTRDELIAKIWDGYDPFVDGPTLPWDGKGYTTSLHRYLTEAVDKVRPRIIVEIGVWKGASTMVMGRRARDLGLDFAVIAIDTWLGSAEHMIGRNSKSTIPRSNGYPGLYFVFLSNCLRYGDHQYIVPLPLDSVNACEVLGHHNVIADIIHIDAGHDYRSVKTDLQIWWPLLRPGGILIGDDYITDDHNPWPGVRQAFDEAFGSALEHDGGKCRVRKAVASSATRAVSSPASVRNDFLE